MAARVEAGTFGATLSDVVADGYYAEAPATAFSLATAWALVRGQVPAGPYLFAYSAADMARQGWPTGELVMRGSGLAVHFGRTVGG